MGLCETQCMGVDEPQSRPGGQPPWGPCSAPSRQMGTAMAMAPVSCEPKSHMGRVYLPEGWQFPGHVLLKKEKCISDLNILGMPAHNKILLRVLL